MSRNKKQHRWYPLIIAILISIVSYSVLSFWGVFNAGVQISSALPDQLFGNTTAGDRAYSLENLQMAIDEKRRTYLVWEREEGADVDIAFARFEYDFEPDYGCAVAPEDIISTSAADDRKEPDVAANDAGKFVVVWADNSATVAADGYDIVFNLYDADCNAIAIETRVNTYTTGNQIDPAVSIDNDGNFVVVWEGPCDNNADGTADDDQGICARGFNGNGVALDANEYLVNAASIGQGQQDPDIALDISGSGDFVVVWWGRGTGDSVGVFLQGFLDYGTPVSGGNELVNITTSGDQSKPSIAASKGGSTLRYVVTWQGQGAPDTTGIYARRGTACSATDCPFANTELSVNTTTTGTQTDPVVDMNYQGDFVVTWREGDYGQTVRAQFFTYGGSLIGTERSVGGNGFTAASSQGLGAPVLGVSADGYTAVMDDYCSSGCDAPDTATLKWFGQGYEGFIYQTGTNLASTNFDSYSLGGVVDVDVAVNQTDGTYVVVWSGNAEDGGGVADTQGIWFTLVDRDGNVINSKQNVRVNTLVAGDQNRPRVSFSQDDGSFVVCYDGAGDINGDSVAEDNGGIFYRRYDSTGQFLDTYEVMVTEVTGDTYRDCDVAAGSNGGFVVAGENNTGSNVFISREGTGGTSTPESPTIGNPASRYAPSVAMDSTNDFIFAWNQGDVYLTKGTHDAGMDVTDPIAVADTDDNQSEPVVTLNDDGLIVVAWQDRVGMDYDIKARPYQLNGIATAPSALAAEFTVNQLTTDDQITPALATDGSNNFVATWLSEDGPMPESAVATWFYWDDEGDTFVINSPEMLLDELHFSVIAANDYGPAASPAALYNLGDLYTFTRAKDSLGYNLNGAKKKLVIGDEPALSSTLEQEILSGGRTLVVPDALSFPAVNANTQSAVTNTIAFEDNALSAVDYIEVQDLFADGNPYNVTISISTPFTFDGTAEGCTTEIYCIPNANLEVRNYDQDGDIKTTVFGDAAAFSLNSSTDSFAALSSQRTLATGTGQSVGRWRFYPELRLTVQANVPPGNHSAVLTFSLN